MSELSLTASDVRALLMGAVFRAREDALGRALGGGSARQKAAITQQAYEWLRSDTGKTFAIAAMSVYKYHQIMREVEAQHAQEDAAA